MVDRYYNWFLQNYKFYSYVGPKARAVLKSIEVFIASNDPNIYNFHTIYASFMALYKGNIITAVKRQQGIFPVRGNYFLLFEEDDVLVPLAYIEFYKRVSDIELENVVRSEIKNQEIKYDSLVGQKEVLVNKCDRLIRSTGNHTQEVKDARINQIYFFLLIFLPLTPTIILLIDDLVNQVFLPEILRWFLFAVSLTLTLLYIVVSWGFFEDVVILQRGKRINQKLYDLELKIHSNSKLLSEINVRKLVVSIKEGKKVKHPITDLDYKELYYKAEDDMEDIEKDKKIKIKIKKIFYQISNVILITFTSLLISLFILYFSLGDFTGYELITILISLGLTVVLFFPLLKIYRNIRIRNVVITILISTVITFLIWYLLII